MKLMVVTIGLLTLCACKDRNADKSKPETLDHVTPASESSSQPKSWVLPHECADWGAQVEKLRACSNVSETTRKILIDGYESASSSGAWRGESQAPSSMLATSCATSMETVVTVLREKCPQPGDADIQANQPKLSAAANLASLQKERDQTDAALQIARSMASSSQYDDKTRNAAKAKIPELEKDEARLDKELAAAKATESDKRTKGMNVSKECLDNPLAKGCS